ncbi:MAG: tRNA (adenosine(37)-N6)-threonylcarbamoyltransferase complex dimerization subunit type 1 TsaB [Legionellaceae bacterium]|nr:tRNA (adenosine(37)-N6)-threonylcarbamoyltransferase complex dimerization subunit type 1 TsaB [Legionellaceae bacterium]
MKKNLLAIDTSTERATIAISAHGKVYSEEQTNLRQHAQCLLPMIDSLLIKSGLALKQLDGIVFGCGPGSFTGLRITCSVAKALAYAHDLPLFSVSSLQAIAQEAYESEPDIDASVGVLALLDARMHEVYWAYFDQSMVFINTESYVSSAVDIVLSVDKPFILAGVGLDTYAQQLSSVLQARILKQRVIFPNAEAMIRLAQTGKIQPVSAADALPIYVRNQVTQGDKRG